jgi:hypothetical protein
MRASKFTDAQKAFILKQGSDGMPVADVCRKAGISQATHFNRRKNCAEKLKACPAAQAGRRGAPICYPPEPTVWV